MLDLLRRRAAIGARRGVAAMPTGTRELVLALGARGRGGPSVLPGPPRGRVLVVAPHPDDEVIGPGGAVARHLDAGDPVRVLLVTSGGATSGGGRDVTAAREEETRRALAHLGQVEAIVCARMEDGSLAASGPAVAERVEAEATGADVVYVPSLLDPHPDHRAVSLAVARAGLPPSSCVMAYEVWGAGPVDVLLDVTDVFDRKQAALAEYTTALQTVDYVRAASGLAAYRSAAGGLGGRGFAEGFTQVGAEEHRRLAAMLDPTLG